MASTNWGEIAKTVGEGFEALPIGDYEVVVEAAAYKLASTGSDMFNCTFVVTAGPSKGRKVWTNLVLKKDSPNAVAAFFGKMRALGIDAEFFATLPNDNEELAQAMICQALVGKTALATLKQSEWKGKVGNDVDQLKPLASGSAGIPSLAPTPTGVPVIPAVVPSTPVPAATAPVAPF